MSKKHTVPRPSRNYQQQALKPAGCLLVLIFLLLCLAGRLSAQSIRLNLKNTDLAQVVTTLQQQAPLYKYSFQQEALEKVKLKEVNISAASFAAAVRQLQEQYGLQYLLEGNTISFKYVPEKNASLVPKKNMGKVTGKIIDEQEGQPITDATIRIGTKGTTTGADGYFSVALPEGDYTVTISHVGYSTKAITGIEVKSNQTFELNATLTNQKGQMSAVVVTASAKKESAASLYARQKNNAAITDGISREQIQRTPDNNVGQVLKRVSGITVHDNKFITVRGMSERYNNVQLNGASLPSTEPNRRNFSFDIVPSSLIDNVVVNKTFTPDLPGEFSGGLIQISTIDIPTQKYFTISAGTGFNTNSSGRDFKSTKRYSNDFYGGGKDRSWYNRAFNYAEYQKVYMAGNATGETLTKMNAFNSRIPNNWGLHKYKVQPMQTYQLSGGQAFQLKNGNTIGLNLAATYRHEENIEDFEAQYRAIADSTKNGKRYLFITALGGIGNLAWQSKKHKLVWRNLYNRRFTHTTMTQDMSHNDSGEGQFYSEYYSNVLINTLWQTRLEGEHMLTNKGLKFTWFADYNHLDREQPDDRYSQGMYTLKDAATQLPILTYDLRTPTMAGSHLFITKLRETKKNVGGNIEQTFKMMGHTQKLKAGYWGTFRDVHFEQAGLRVLTAPDADNAQLYGLPDYKMFDTENFVKNLLYYKISYPGGNSAGDQYTGDQQIHAGYLMADLVPLNKLRIIGGARLEKANMNVETLTRLERNDPNNPLVFKDTTMNYRETEWLPSFTAIYSLTSKINLRAAYSKTLARPDFRERSTFFYYDVVERVELSGNDGLAQSHTGNYDARLEWYPAAGEVVSVSAFYKKFISPVELVSYLKTSGGYTLFYFNLDNSTVKGLEMDFRKSLGFIHQSSRFLRNLYISGNATYLKGNVAYNNAKLADQASGIPPDRRDSLMYTPKFTRNRPLQGLAPYIINTGINYQGSVVGVNITYNRFGKRLSLAGLEEMEDEYELPRDVLDAQLSVRFMKQKLEIKLNIADLLNQNYIDWRNTDKYKQANIDSIGNGYNADVDWTLHKVKRGSNCSLNISYRF